MASTVLVTGATGYVASHCVRLLLQQGYRIRGTVRSLKDNFKVEALRQTCPKSADGGQLLDLVEADLTSDGQEWFSIVKGCSHVLHVASPVILDPLVPEKDIIQPAVNGTVHILRACDYVGDVKRVVLTSSLVAVNGAWECRSKPWTEREWTDTTDPSLPPYFKGKTLAEKAAWKFVENLPEERKFELASINPSLVMGPPLFQAENAATEPMVMLMENRMGFIPRLGVSFVDVRDVALGHVNAMIKPRAAGQRHIMVGHQMRLEDIATMLREEFEPQGYDIPSEVRRFDIAGAPKSDEIPVYDTSRMKEILGVEPREARHTIIDMVYKMIEIGQIKKRQ